MSNNLKRVKCSLYLDPINSESDRYAFSIMKSWAHEQMQLVENPVSGQELHEKLHKHKKIYLSGLYLYLLSPTLTSLLSSALLPDDISMKVFAKKLEVCGLMLPSNEHISESGVMEQMKLMFSEQIGMLSENLQESIHQRNVADEEQKQSFCYEAFVEQAKEIAELKALMLSQSQMLRTFQHNVPIVKSSKGTFEVEQDLNKIIANVKKIKKKGIF